MLPSLPLWRPGKTWRRLLCCALAGAGLLGASAARAQEGGAAACKQLIASGNPQYPPYLWRDTEDESRLVGANAEMLTWLSKELGLPIEARYIGPWGRVQEEARAGRIDLIAGAFFTLPRTEYMDYFHPPFRETRSVVWVREGSRLNYRRWADLAPLQGITVINNSFGEEFDRYAREHLKLAQVASLEQALQMLQRSRADYLVYEDSPAAAYQARLNIGDLKALTPPVANENLHLTLSHRSACNTPELRGRIARAMYKLARQGLMQAWVDKHIQLWKRQSP
ncbi:ABC transporter substrate-binding protein [Roseateles sp. DAIF2]|uniref:substrate-binding periplasmic protein n=1 Tax=Roseateles sp. DAIF2 TaxID=2714952 RepID=UPI001BC8F0E9|nr:transporter substrate-binding domain-containing protein [Roseateles sp. DAIF2]